VGYSLLCAGGVFMILPGYPPIAVGVSLAVVGLVVLREKRKGGM